MEIPDASIGQYSPEPNFRNKGWLREAAIAMLQARLRGDFSESDAIRNVINETNSGYRILQLKNPAGIEIWWKLTPAAEGHLATFINFPVFFVRVVEHGDLIVDEPRQ